VLVRRPLLARTAKPTVTRVVILAAAITGAVSCAAIAGINDGAEKRNVATDAAVAISADGAASGTDGATSADGTVPACPAPGNAADTATSMHASKVKTPVVLDGDGAEWSCVDRFAFTGGQRVVNLAAGRGIADVAMQWDEQHLYVWASVTTAAPAGNAPRATNYQNDSFSFFVSQPAPTSAYTANDHHIVLDSTNLLTDYAIGTRTGLAGINGKAGSVHDDGVTLTFVVELQIAASIVGRTAFATNDTVRVNFQINDGPSGTPPYRIWMLDPSVCTPVAGCTVQGTSEPYCDPRCTGVVTLR
jgi:hypothetical protein